MVTEMLSGVTTAETSVCRSEMAVVVTLSRIEAGQLSLHVIYLIWIVA